MESVRAHTRAQLCLTTSYFHDISRPFYPFVLLSCGGDLRTDRRKLPRCRSSVRNKNDRGGGSLVDCVPLVNFRELVDEFSPW
jgi:hypothetical protein